MKTLPEGDTSVAQDPGANNEGPGLSGLQPETALGTDKWIPLEGRPYSYSSFRRSRSAGYIDEHAATGVVSGEHRTLMGTVVEKVLSAKSGLNEAFTSLLRGIEVCTIIFSIVFYSQNAPVYR